jgi:hypothetical protein
MVTINIGSHAEDRGHAVYAVYAWVVEDETGARVRTHRKLVDYPWRRVDGAAEYAALINALRFARSEGLHSVRLYSSCRQTIDAVYGLSPCVNPDCNALRDVAAKMLAELGAVLELDTSGRTALAKGTAGALCAEEYCCDKYD